MALTSTCPGNEFVGWLFNTLKKVSIAAFSLLLLVILTILYGGLVAGHKAGLIYNTYPLMGDRILPSDLLFLTPAFQNLLANATLFC